MSDSVTIKSGRVLDAFDSKDQYYGPRNEDGQRPILNPPHAWFILVTDERGNRWFLLEDAPFETWGKWLEEGEQDYRGDAVRQAGMNLVFRDEADAINKKRAMEARLAAILEQGTLDIYDDDDWDGWPYPEYGSKAWEQAERAMARAERQGW